MEYGGVLEDLGLCWGFLPAFRLQGLVFLGLFVISMFFMRFGELEETQDDDLLAAVCK